MIIRRYRTGDAAALYDICLRTGDAGADASGQYADPELLGHIYVGPYLRYAAPLALVLDDGTGPVGYALGVADTATFEQWCERVWWPPLRAAYPDPVAVPEADRTPQQRLAHRVHHPPRTPARVLAGFPAHLHIDLLPAAQGQGLGRRLLTEVLQALAAAGAPGVHLGVDPRNTAALAFYHRLGFAPLTGSWLARPLTAAS